MKLNYKRTVCVGFAFFLITAFWQAYDTIIPKILTDRFGMSQTVSGIIMAMDNILALFLLPLFGVLSDKTKTKLGKRTPFILAGTLVAALTFASLSFVDAYQLKQIRNVTALENTEAREILYNYDYPDTLIANDGSEFVLKELYTEEEFVLLPSTVEDGNVNEAYANHVIPARQEYIRTAVTQNNPSTLILFIGLLLVVLLSMATFRTPAVALMPDVTPKPLRSKGNAIINLMGTIGGSLILALGMIFGTGNVKNAYMSYAGYFCSVAAIMLICLMLFLATVRENRFLGDMEKESASLGIDEREDLPEESKKLTKSEKKSFLLLLCSVVFWYAGYNAVISKYSVYAGEVLGQDYNSTLLIANVAALVSFIPVGIISTKLGRKKTVLAGVVMLGTAFFGAAFAGAGTPLPVMMAAFVLAGIGWATINVNSFPMVVELAKGGNVGKYTGFYYTASMAAQTITPVVSGAIMDAAGMKALFPYATFFVCLAFITMLFVKHGDAKPLKGAGTDFIPEAD